MADWTTASRWGGAGIGIGIGGWGAVERLTIANCTALANGTNGIFLELQKDYWTPPRGYRIVGCHSQGNRFGISDWGADGLIVSACTMTGNLETGFDVSAQGTSSVAGRGGLLTDCVIDGNLCDGVSIGNSPGPYTVRGNRISGNGRHGYHAHDLGRGYRGSIRDVVIESNEFWGNGLDAVRIDHQMTDAVLLNNRIRNNGRQYGEGTSGAGDAVRYSERCLVDRSANWPHDGHRGKVLRVGKTVAMVAANTGDELTLAPVRPDAFTAWSGDVPPPGSAYELAAAPQLRAGITIDAPFDSATIRGNRIWDNHDNEPRPRRTGCGSPDGAAAWTAGSRTTTWPATPTGGCDWTPRRWADGGATTTWTATGVERPAPGRPGRPAIADESSELNEVRRRPE